MPERSLRPPQHRSAVRARSVWDGTMAPLGQRSPIGGADGVGLGATALQHVVLQPLAVAPRCAAFRRGSRSTRTTGWACATRAARPVSPRLRLAVCWGQQPRRGQRRCADKRRPLLAAAAPTLPCCRRREGRVLLASVNVRCSPRHTIQPCNRRRATCGTQHYSHRPTRPSAARGTPYSRGNQGVLEGT